MANINISNLAEKTTVNDNDVLLVEDASSTNKVTKANLLKEVNAKIPTKVSQLTNDSGYLTSIPSEYITESELSSKGYLTAVPEEYVTETELSSKGFITEHQDISGKVDKIPGKGLSTNDYTTTEKNKLAGIAAGANNYTHPTTHPASMITGLSSVATSGDYADLSGKPTIPTVDSALSSTSTNPVQNKAIQAALASKVNTESGKGLSSNDYTTTEKNKLAGIATGANNYTHPSTHPASMITGLSTVATSGNYNDLSGKPVIPVITSGTEELTPGESPLADGVVYLQYE